MLIKKITGAVLLLGVQGTCFSQSSPADSLSPKTMSEIIVTGQFRAQSLKKSVYQVKVINRERIQQSAATTVQQVLATQVGFRFSNDNTLGTTDVQLMGMSGRNVKILLDGVPLIDRGDTRESLNQVDVNIIDRIEIVQGPMSVVYGTDALAGVINIITKKINTPDLKVAAKLQEETAGNEYHPFNYKGVHQQNIAVQYRKNNWTLAAGGTHNDHDGFGGDEYGRGKTWKPKEQWLANAKIGFTAKNFFVYYRIDGLNEIIKSRNPINYNNNKATDQRYTTNRLSHQLQGSYSFSNQLQLATVIGYTDYERRTKTVRHDFEKNTEELTTGAGEQDISAFKSFVLRNTLQYEINNKLSLQPGMDINYEKATGQRIAGNPSITDYAAFVSAEIKPNSKINLRPGLRFIKNSVYDAPPVIPSLNTKFIISHQWDVSLSYAYGFRSPALRELYFNFVDANHNITGNPNLKAEYSNSFNGSLNWAAEKNNTQYSAAFTGFYNSFQNQIDFALASASSNQYTYFNVNSAKTTGGTIETKAIWKNTEAGIGFTYIGYSRHLYDDKDYIKESNKEFLWSPEVAVTASRYIPLLKTKLNLFYKFTGKKPQYVTGTNAASQEVLYIAETAGFSFADFTTFTQLNKYVAVQAGMKNIFDVTNVNNTAASSGSIHSSAGSVPVSYGRSYFIGLNFQWNKK